MSEKVAIVTAGGSGMGAAAAKRLAKDGFKIAILSSSGKGEALALELGGIGVTGSNQSPDDLKRLVDGTMERWGRIDALVNSAGHGPRAPIIEITDEQWHGSVLHERGATNSPGCSNHEGAEERCDRQHLDGLGIRAKCNVPDFSGVPCRARRLHQDLHRYLCR